jgi:ABC-2 type transport system ATP-binding protein
VSDVVCLQRLTKSYGPARGVVDLDLTVGSGEVFGFLGPNRAGKTTTIRTMLDLIRPTSGRVLIFGLDARTDGKCWERRPAGEGERRASLPRLRSPPMSSTD